MLRLLCILAIFIIILGVLPNYSTKPPEKDLILNNGCVIYAIQYQHSLKAKKILNDSEIWSKIIFYKLKEKKMGHAVVLYIYGNSTYVYDPAVASYQLSQYPIYNPYKIVQLMHPLSKVIWAEYAENVLLYNP